MLSEPDAMVLEALATQGEGLVAKLNEGTLVFRSKLRFVDPRQQFLLLEPTADASVNAALLRMRRVDLLVEWGEWRISFSGNDPQLVTDAGSEAVRVGFPEALSINRRRMLPRAPIPQQPSLLCTFREESGAVWLVGEITDISQGGIGMLIEAPAIVEPGMQLSQSSIEGPGREPVFVDLEVRHTERIHLPSGRVAMRLGCKFTNLSPEIVALVANYFGKKQ